MPADITVCPHCDGDVPRTSCSTAKLTHVKSLVESLGACVDQVDGGNG